MTQSDSLVGPLSLGQLQAFMGWTDAELQDHLDARATRPSPIVSSKDGARAAAAGAEAKAHALDKDV